MDIYSVLARAEHNIHYLNRYVKFINACMIHEYKCYTEVHHICPQAMFPEYKDLSINNWNSVTLTARQHFIAHILLWKAFPNEESQKFALYAMKYKNKEKLNSKSFEKLKMECIYLLKKNSSKQIHTNASKEKRSNKMKNKIWYTDGVKNLRLNPTDVIPFGFKPGRTMKITNNMKVSRRKSAAKIGLLNKDKITAYDLYNKKYVSISREEFHKNKQQFCGATSKRITSFDL